VVQVPTTLLAQVDSSIGGKTAVNLAGVKNLVGTFHQPRLVLADTAVLRTLPDREYRAGIYEALKCGAIADQALFTFCEKNADQILGRDATAVERMIDAAVQVKAQVVAQDEREAGRRRILNFGHTAGHALEAVAGPRRLLHGEAVALGMIAAAEIGVNAGITPVDVAERLIAGILRFGRLPRVKVPVPKLMSRIAMDKKSHGGRARFVLLDGLGSAVAHEEVSAGVVRDALRSVIA
jgi:3-dehydroquinate synthase